MTELSRVVDLSCFYKQLLKILREKTNKNVLKRKDKNKEVKACVRKKELFMSMKQEGVSRNQRL